MVIGQHKTVPVLGDSDQQGPERRLTGEVADRDAFGGAQSLNLVFVGYPRRAEIEELPRDFRLGRDHLHRFVELLAERGRQVRMPVDGALHGIAKSLRVQRAGQCEIQLHRVHFGRDVGPLVRGAAVEQQTLLQRRQRQDVGNAALLLQLVDLLLPQPRRCDVRWRQTAATRADVCADTGQRLEPQPAQPVQLGIVENRGRPGPVGLQLGSGVGVDGAGVEFHGVEQRQRGRGAGQGQFVASEPPQFFDTGDLRKAQAPKVVEPDARLRAVQIDVLVEVAQQPVGQACRLRAQLFLGRLDDGTERLVARGDLRPRQLAHRQRNRVFGGEPADGPRQVDIVGNVFVAPVAFDVDADGRPTGAQELRDRERETDQQDVLHAGVECRRHLAEEGPGVLGVERHRQPARGGVGVHIRVRGGQSRGYRGRLLPGRCLRPHVRMVRIRAEQRGPPLERRACRRQLHRLAGAMLRPRNVDVFQQDSPRHPVNREVMDDQDQLPAGAYPQGADHDPGTRVQPSPRRGHRGFRQLLDIDDAVAGIDRAGLGYRQRPVGADPQPQHGVPIQQGLQQHHRVIRGGAVRCLQHQGLIELVDRSFDPGEPADDRGGRHRSDALVDDVVRVVGHGHRLRQTRHRLFDEHVTRTACQSGGPGARRHLHRENAVAAQLEERVVDADVRRLQAEDLGIDGGQNLFDRAVRRAVVVTRVLRGGQAPGVELAAGGERQFSQCHDRGRNQIGRQAIDESGPHLDRIDGTGDVTDEALVAGAVLPDDHRRLHDAVDRGQSCLDFAQFDAVATDLDLGVGASDVPQLSVLAPVHQVSGAVHPLAGLAEGTRHET
ncbi:Uncharacterised protein [Mycobacteroides abscessus subsp. abscessus]|nr:Uncharacterised protein [Mycobacteroides abscessus subsp. abscessus]